VSFGFGVAPGSGSNDAAGWELLRVGTAG
jgi:hypothetical protein